MDYANNPRFWQESASLVRLATADEFRDLLYEGKLWELVAIMGMLSRGDRSKLLISFPDRNVAPTKLEGKAVESLLAHPLRPITTHAKLNDLAAKVVEKIARK